MWDKAVELVCGEPKCGDRLGVVWVRRDDRAHAHLTVGPTPLDDCDETLTCFPGDQPPYVNNLWRVSP